MANVVVRKDNFAEFTRKFHDGILSENKEGADEMARRSNARKPARVETSVEREDDAYLIGWGSNATFWASFVETGTVHQPAHPFAKPAAEAQWPAIKRALSNMEKFVR